MRVQICSCVLVALACPAGDGASETGAGSTSDTSVTSPSSSSSSEASSAGDGSTTAPMGDGILQCIETCRVPSECCLPNTPCPGPYPFNFDCREGLCVPATCDDDASCVALDPDQVCLEVRALRSCVTTCAGDADCTAPAVCTGVTDAGTSYCFTPCTAPGQFCGNQTCDPGSGLCVCETDGQCQSDWTCLD